MISSGNIRGAAALETTITRRVAHFRPGHIRRHQQQQNPISVNFEENQARARSSLHVVF